MDWLKVFPEVFKGMVDVIRELQSMVEGHKSKQAIFWMCFVLGILVVLMALTLLLNPAYESVSAVASHFNINLIQVDVNIPSSIFPNLLLALVLTLLYMVVLAGIAVIIGAFLSTITNVIFAPYTTERVDKVFSELIPLLENLNKDSPNESVNKLLTDATSLRMRWDKLRVTKMARWLQRITKRPKKEGKRSA